MRWSLEGISKFLKLNLVFVTDEVLLHKVLKI